MRRAGPFRNAFRSTSCPSRRRSRGVIYLFLLFAVAIAGILLAGTGEMWSTAARRDKEAELLFVGDEYRRAIAGYRDATPGETKEYPATLDDLLLDKRVPGLRRHLRKLYRDPMSRDGKWGLIMSQGRIVGVHSLSLLKPIKEAGFKDADSAFAEAKSYTDWRFNVQ